METQTNSNIGRLTTFSGLLRDEPVVMIPKVQRDYAYGRKEEKVESILDTMLESMLSAVKEKRVEVFDFVYGGAYVKDSDVSDKKDGLIPLDGQQRLTTMFLLYLYASIIQPNVDEDSDSFRNLRKFRYETRQSATNFCEALVDEIRKYLREGDRYSKHENIKGLIMDNPYYLPNYDSDPTIISMLNVLEVIEGKCNNDYKIDNLWSELVNHDYIQFYCLSLDRFGLTDDLYIKMNSRGKKLTEFEIFKSDFEKKVEEIAPDLKDELTRLIDNDWMDVLWGYANLYGSDDDNKVERADKGYMFIFNNIFRIELFRRGIEGKTNRKAKLEEIIRDRDDVCLIMDIFNALSGINNKESDGIVAHWDKYFYFSDEAIGGEDKVRLFWQQKQSRKPVFYLAMEEDLSLPEILYFYTLVKIRLMRIDDEGVVKNILRVVRNLVTSSTRVQHTRYDRLRGYLRGIDSIIENKGICEGKSDTFLDILWEEEQDKSVRLSCIYDSLLKYENHVILQGSLRLFIDKYCSDNGDVSALLDKLRHFEKIFDNNYVNRFDDLRISLINPSNEYMQYETSMKNDNRRLFIHTPEDFSQFITKNNRRENQTAILDEIAAVKNPDSLKKPDEKCREFGIKTWEYYYVKYPYANIPYTSYGCYAWDDKQNKPLEMVILNSSYHSENYIEWKMLNHILYKVLNDDSKYFLDRHGSMPLEFIKSGITMTISQGGWLLRCNDMNLFKSVSQVAKYKISKEEEDNMYLLDFRDDNPDIDYIELAQQFISDFNL